MKVHVDTIIAAQRRFALGYDGTRCSSARYWNETFISGLSCKEAVRQTAKHRANEPHAGHPRKRLKQQPLHTHSPNTRLSSYPGTSAQRFPAIPVLAGFNRQN